MVNILSVLQFRQERKYGSKMPSAPTQSSVAATQSIIKFKYIIILKRNFKFSQQLQIFLSK
jgi:hypothetical protein